MNARILKLLPLLVAAALFAGCKKEPAPVPPVPGPGGSPAAGPGGSGSAPAGIVSAEKNSFDQVTAKLDKGGSFYLYLSTEQALGSLSRNLVNYSNVFSQTPVAPMVGGQTVARIFEVIGGLIKDSGVEHISGVGASSIAREKGFYYSKFIVHHYEGQGDGLIWSAFGKAPHSLKELDLLPEDTVFAAYADLDVPLALKTVEAELKKLHLPEVDKALAAMPEQFKSVAGMDMDDALGSLEGGYGVIFTLDPSTQVTLPTPTSVEIPEPGLAIYFKVKNAAIYNRVDQATTGNPLVARINQDGVKTLSLAISIPLPIKLSPTLALNKDYLILTSSDQLLQDILAVQSGKKSGFKSTAEFKKLSQGVPSEGNNFSIISEKFGKSLSKAMQGLASQEGAAGAQSKTLQDMMASNAVTFAYAVSVNGPSGWETYANGNTSMGSSAVVLPAVAAGGLLAAIAIPNFVRARTTSQVNACINNLRMIDGAKQQWALENHKQNSDTPTVQDLTPYIGFGPAGQFPTCPEGGTYIIGTVAEKPRCTTPGHVLP
jgi:hypothetical protein